jgi:predicted DCC family thiol-disulfide oxidoreductase YuxK
MGADREVAIVFFDGECNLCNTFVNFIIKRDRKVHFNFASLQSSFASKFLGDNLVEKGMNTVVLRKNSSLFFKSDAALEIAKNLSGLWPTFYILKIVPKFIRDFIYDWIAANRYRWFGKTSCLVPSEELKARFIE